MAAKPTISGEKYWDRGLGYVVAMDGSPVSKQAFNSAMEHFSMDPRDHLDVIHVEDLAKEYLPYDMKRASVEEWCSVHGKTLFNKRYQFRTYLKDVKASTKQVVLDALRDVPKADILIVGYVGRKGPKEDPQVSVSLGVATVSAF